MESEQENATVTLNKNRMLTFEGIAFIVVVFSLASYAMVVSGAQNTNYGNAPTGNAVKNYALDVQGGKQTVKLTMQGSTYNPDPVKLKKGVPAVLDVDTNSVRGCYRGIQIPAFNVRKIVTESDNKIEFTPDKAGTFGFSCFMGMGQGQIVVEDETGNVPSLNTVAQDIPSGTCGSGGGGCGCGGY